MLKSLKVFLISFLMLGVVSAAQAAVYGYINVVGRDQDQIAREVETIERLIKTWKNGEVLYTHTVKSGAVFFKKITATVFFAGEQSKISSFLSAGSYEGDYLKNIVVKFNYVSFNKQGEEVNTVFTRKYNNIRDAVKAVKDKDDKAMWKDLAETRKRDYAKHDNKGAIVDGIVNVVFYSLQPVEENRLFGITFKDNKVKNTRN